MRNYEEILTNIQDQGKTDTQVYNLSGGKTESDPEEAIATIQAISVYRKNNLAFAEAIRRQINGKY